MGYTLIMLALVRQRPEESSVKASLGYMIDSQTKQNQKNPILHNNMYEWISKVSCLGNKIERQLLKNLTYRIYIIWNKNYRNRNCKELGGKGDWFKGATPSCEVCGLCGPDSMMPQLSCRCDCNLEVGGSWSSHPIVSREVSRGKCSN